MFDLSRLRLVLIFGLLALSLVFVSCATKAQQTISVAGLTTEENPPRVGLRVLNVHDGSVGSEAGLKAMDIISKYGDFAIVDSASYFAARDAYEKYPAAKVEMVYWRGRQRVAIQVSSGRLGIEFNEYNPVAYELGVFINELDLTLQDPEYVREAKIAKGETRPIEKIVEDARAIIGRASLDGTLTPAQILVARINTIPDNAPASEIEMQTKLISELVSTQPESFTKYLGYEVFFMHGRYRPAVACFKRSLSSDPSDIGRTLNLGVAYNALGMFTEGDAVASSVLDRERGLNDYGLGVAFQVKAGAALSRHDFAQALNYAEKAFRSNPTSPYLMSLWQLAAAQNNDLERFYQANSAAEKALPKEFGNLKPRRDAIEAYILTRNNQAEKARQIARAWVGRDKLLSNATYWKQFPSGDDIVKCWKELLGQS
jgi:tetratricopeptide (TPR) repeat protein